MSARGARSRKVQQKDIEKKDKKTAVKGKAPETQDAFADWRATPSTNGPRSTGLTRTISNRSHGTSHSGGTSGSASRSRLNTVYSNESSSYGKPPKTSASGSASVSDHSAKGKEKTKFQANGKETKAPRGRGGGVPTKIAVAPTPLPFRTESPAPRLPSHKRTWLDFKVWDGSKEDMRPYGGFAFDEDMHNGSVLIYFKEEQMDEDQPVPSIRAELDVLTNSGSSWLTKALMMGRLDEDEDDWALTAADEFMSPMPQYGRSGRMLSPTTLGSLSPPPLDIDRSSSRAPSRSAARTPRIDRARSPSSAPLRQNSQRNPTHEIWFTAPSDLRSLQSQRLHHVAVRNFLAMLHGKPIVGADVFDMLSTLQTQIQVMYDLDTDVQSTTSAERSVQMITNYMGQYGIDDVCNDIKHAVSLLAWAEQDSVRWRQGYLECYAHLAGAITPQIEESSEFRRLSVVTRRNLGIAAKTLQLRVMEAEEKMAGFDFTDLWKSSPKLMNGPVYRSYQAFRQFLISHYERIYGMWPPPSQGTWLNRKTILAMQNDFGSLYDYLVDRDVYWNPREERASRKWEMQHRKNDQFEADLPELAITDMLVVYDAQAGYTHIPHPYPLLPREVPTATKEKEKKGFFSSLRKDKTKDVTKDAKAHLQLSIVFSDATNIEKLDVNFNGSTLIDKFEQFELTTDLKNITPREARLGRWVLLYGILQLLSTLSVDVHGLKHTEGVRHFLCTDLKRCPEWVTNGQTSFLEPAQQRSWCWQRAWDPTPIRAAPVELDATASPDRAPAAPPRSPRKSTPCP
ncbi:hypothetical protein OPT61_g4442 [Boeremia exigua]|uniref:Uncharacterized protein n=1 Tax=Boeremia exigua TaxID=749465 RepID=A0ACC2IE42_9PLEO|nr:hypothetical protein OPT61_g4442 [Boeremia exigua]